ncbi:MAG: hypothetical protein ACLFM6_10020 [Spirochaetaceae bacterium]
MTGAPAVLLLLRLLRVLRRILLPAALAVALAFAGGTALDHFGVIEEPLHTLARSLGLAERRTYRSSQVILEHLGEVHELDTVAYIHRTVFPFDYDTPRARALAEDVGLEAEEFVVVTVQVTAGYELSDIDELHVRPVEAGPEQEATRPDTAGAESATGAGEGPGVHVRVPPASVTEVVVEDVDPETYDYPDVAMDAAGWSEVAAFVTEHAETRTVAEGIIEEAEDNARSLVRTLLLQAGFDYVSFAKEAKSSANGEERR